MNETKKALVKQLFGNTDEVFQKMRTMLVESLDVVREIMPPQIKEAFLADVDSIMRQTTDMVQDMYAEAFSEEEIESLLRWMNDSSVRKASELLPRIHERAVNIGVSMARKSIERYAAELDTVVKAKNRESGEVDETDTIRTPKTFLN